MKLELRYERAFLKDMQRLNPADYERAHRFLFEQFPQLRQLYQIPGLRQISNHATYYRFPLGNHLVALEVTGQIVKFLRIVPKPNIPAESRQS